MCANLNIHLINYKSDRLAAALLAAPGVARSVDSSASGESA